MIEESRVYCIMTGKAVHGIIFAMKSVNIPKTLRKESLDLRIKTLVSQDF